MANLYTDSALKALNEEDYINKLYDTNSKKEQELIKQNYTDNAEILDTEQERVQEHTRENVNRTQVEAQSSQQNYNGPKLTLGDHQQEALSRGNAQKVNVSSLDLRQKQLDAEIERQRKLLASQYETAIKQAKEDNDMQRAQQLYTAAKEEEAMLLELKRQASSILAEYGDTSIQDALMKGETPSVKFSGKTWKQVLKNESTINDIYDKQLESERLGLAMDYEEAMSDLVAKQAQQQAKADQDLTKAYVDALKKQKNYAEVQTAYGQGSGTASAARIAQDVELQKTLTDLRLAQMEADAEYGMEGFDIGQAYRDKLLDSQKGVDQKRAEELLKAAEQEEANLYETQLQIGQDLAENGDWSVLGKLYGLTQDQIDRIQGTGAYAPVYYDYGGDDGVGSPSPAKPFYEELYRPYNVASEKNILLAMKNNK